MNRAWCWSDVTLRALDCLTKVMRLELMGGQTDSQKIYQRKLSILLEQAWALGDVPIVIALCELIEAM